MVNLFGTGGLLSKKNLSAWLSLLLLFHLPLLLELYLLLAYWPQWWPSYLIFVMSSMVLGAVISGRLLYLRLDRARKVYDDQQLTRLLGTYLIPLTLVSPGLISTVIGLLLIIPSITKTIGSLLIRTLAIPPQQWYNSILLVHTRDQERPVKAGTE